MFPLDDNFVFGDIFFCGWYFFFGRRPKKNTQPTKKKYSPTNEVTHPTETPICLWYDVFMPPPPSKFPFNILFFVSLVDNIFFPKKTSLVGYFQLVTFHFILNSHLIIAFFFTTLDFSFILKMWKSWFL